jgi:hypothetical protein
MSHLKYVFSLLTLKKAKMFRYTKTILMVIGSSRSWYSGVDLKVFRYMFTDVSKGPAAYFLRLRQQVRTKSWFTCTRVWDVPFQNAVLMALLFVMCAFGKMSSLFCDNAPPTVEYVIERKIEGRIEVTGRWGRWGKQLLDDLKETVEYCKLKRKH